MAYKNLGQFITKLESMGQLTRISEFVSPRLEMTEINDRVVKNRGPALLFENNGTDFPVLLNAFAGEKRICTALSVENLDDISQRIDELMKSVSTPPEGLMGKLRMLPMLHEISSWMPKHKKGRGECQQVVFPQPDMSRLPVLTCWPFDGGPFITLPLVHTIHPDTGHRNTGMYRVQVFDRKTLGMHWQLHKTGTKHYEAWKKHGKRMPVAVVLGGDPVYTYAATAPLPDNIDEYLLAGFIRRKSVNLVKCLTNELQVPDDADFVIEGYVEPHEALALEGPFGDHTGYYSLADFYPQMHITCITHRRGAVYPATIVGIPPQEDEWLGKATERIFLAPIRLTMNPEVVDMNLPTVGVFHNIAIVSIQKEYDGQAYKIMNSLWGAGQMMFNKIMIVVNSHVNVNDYNAVMAEIAANVDVLSDIHFFRGPADVLDHAVDKFAFGGKMGIDATNSSKSVKRDILPGIEAELRRNHTEVTDVSLDLAKKGILLIAVRKNREQHIRLLHQSFINEGLLAGIDFVVYTEDVADLTDLYSLVWRIANNIDPARDCFYGLDSFGRNLPCLAIDGSRKSAAFDGFKRLWPNIVTMNTDTIVAIDKKWDSLGLGPLLTSPSVKYQKQLYKGGAVADE
jgi:4-hydroxy-3-polyprenylbenzoate decarboxylase